MCVEPRDTDKRFMFQCVSSKKSVQKDQESFRPQLLQNELVVSIAWLQRDHKAVEQKDTSCKYKNADTGLQSTVVLICNHNML